MKDAEPVTLLPAKGEDVGSIAYHEALGMYETVRPIAGRVFVENMQFDSLERFPGLFSNGVSHERRERAGAETMSKK
jgi:hypothetical protein